MRLPTAQKNILFTQSSYSKYCQWKFSQEAVEYLPCKLLTKCEQFRDALETSRSSNCVLPGVFCKSGVLKNFAKFTGNLLLDKRESGLVQVFFCEIWEIFNNTFFIEHLLWLFLELSFDSRYYNLPYILFIMETWLS